MVSQVVPSGGPLRRLWVEFLEQLFFFFFEQQQQQPTEEGVQGARPEVGLRPGRQAPGQRPHLRRAQGLGPVPLGLDGRVVHDVLPSGRPLRRRWVCKLWWKRKRKQHWKRKQGPRPCLCSRLLWLKLRLLELELARPELDGLRRRRPSPELSALVRGAGEAGQVRRGVHGRQVQPELREVQRQRSPRPRPPRGREGRQAGAGAGLDAYGCSGSRFRSSRGCSGSRSRCRYPRCGSRFRSC